MTEFCTMKKMFLCLTPILLLLSGCASMPLVSPKMPDASNRAEVIVFRESAFNAGGVSLTFGANGQALVYLSNAEFASIHLEPGTYRFFVRARSDDPATLDLTTLKANDRRCFKTYANPLNVAKNFVPFGRLLIKDPAFIVQEVECPPSEELAKYSRVTVEYQK
jgi:hypothetical protein